MDAPKISNIKRLQLCYYSAKEKDLPKVTHSFVIFFFQTICYE